MRRSGDSQDGLRDIASDIASRSVAFDANDPIAPELEVAADLAATEETAGGGRNLAPRSAAKEEFPMKTVLSAAVASNALFIEAPPLAPKTIAHRLSLRCAVSATSKSKSTDRP